MPSGLILYSNGTFGSINVPSSVKEVDNCFVDKSEVFPNGMCLHRMAFLSHTLSASLFYQGNRALSLALYSCPRQVSKSTRRQECNLHEIPKSLDTQMFYGNMLMVLVVDREKVISITQEQYQKILRADVENALTHMSTCLAQSRNKSSLSYSSTDNATAQINKDTSFHEEVLFVEGVEKEEVPEDMELEENPFEMSLHDDEYVDDDDDNNDYYGDD